MWIWGESLKDSVQHEAFKSRHLWHHFQITERHGLHMPVMIINSIGNIEGNSCMCEIIFVQSLHPAAGLDTICRQRLLDKSRHKLWL